MFDFTSSPPETSYPSSNNNVLGVPPSITSSSFTFCSLQQGHTNNFLQLMLLHEHEAGGEIMAGILAKYLAGTV
jgi:hypothetical protein